MGFPACYSEMLAPKLLLRLVLALCYLRRLISWALDLLGLGDLLDPDDDPCPIPPPHTTHYHHHPKFQSLSAMLIHDLLPALPYHDILLDEEHQSVSEECVVCLCDFRREDEVRRLTNCRHVFHRHCLDRWAIDHDQKTCPLCRSPLFSHEMAEMVDGGVPDSLSGGDDESPEVFATSIPVFFS